MNVDRILEALREQKVDFLLIGGMNFMLRHLPLLTFDVDIWIDDVPENRRRCARALAQLQATWGATDETWGPVDGNRSEWLESQGVYCLMTPCGALDVFRQVAGLTSWAECRNRAIASTTAGGIPFLGLCDADMLSCQYALPENQRHPERVRHLETLAPPAPDHSP
ncbi:MAG TPA: hypothetical protein P5204_12060 [Kiritimatiellia bacterium]|nr:hypothetical protein [Kiritimatiellia bacterium]